MVADKEVTHVSPRDPFTVIYPGNIRELNSNVFYKPRPGAKTQLDSIYSGPQALPKDTSKCAHYELEETEISTLTHRCPWKAQKGMANGFLCQDHQTKVIHVEKKIVPPVVRFNDATLIESILKSEARLISQGTKEKVRLTTKGEFITYVS